MRVLIMLLFVITLSFAQKTEYISLGAYSSHIEASDALSAVDNNLLIQELAKRYQFKVTLQKIDGDFNIIVTNFDDKSAISTLYDLLQRDYIGIKTNYKKVDKNKVSEMVWFIMIVMLLVFVALWTMNKSSKKYTELKEQYDRVKSLKDQLMSKHDEMLHNLGYKIETSTRDMITERDKIINEPIKEFTKEVVEKKFKSIQSTDKILTDTTNQIIDFLKAKSGKLQLSHKRFDLNRLLESVTNFVSQNYKGQSVELIYDVNLDVPRYIMGDFNRMSEILINIIDYSFSTTSKGSVKLVISKFDATQNPILEFKILDSSVGLKKEQLSTIFTPFNNKNSSKGGLFIAKELVKLMDGKLDLFTRYGKGNTFAINLPLLIDKGSKQTYTLSNDEKLKKELENKYIGIIDKDEEVANAIKKTFLHFIKSVTIIPHYSLADDDVLNRFDFILIEASMISVELLDRFKNIQKKRDFRIVVMHSILYRDYHEIVDSSIARYTLKPLSPSHALKVFLDEYSTLKVVSSEDEVVLMESMEENFHSNLPKQYANPLPPTKNASKEFFKDFFGSSLLIVDDNLDNQESFSEMFEESGIRYALSNNSTMTMDQLNKYYNNFSLIFINFSVDRGHGYLISKMIRSSRSYDKIPIIAIVNGNEETGELLKIGINAHIIKPMELSTIYTALEEFLDKADLTDPSLKLSQSENILDITRGIMQANHDYHLYIEMLKEFHDAYGESASHFEKLVEEQNYPKLKELVINMKGLSDVLAANNMYQLLKDIELVIQREKYSELDQYAQYYYEEIGNLNNNIEIYLRSTQS